MTSTNELETHWNAWLSDPEHAPVRAVAERFPPWCLYRMKDTDQIVEVVSFYEDGTVKVYNTPDHNSPDDWRTGFEVFGINPDNLELWTPPLDS